jgi:hypothetical protein
MKAVLRVPTSHQYAYIEVEMEGTQEEIINKYLQFTTSYKTAQKKWDADNEQPF